MRPFRAMTALLLLSACNRTPFREVHLTGEGSAAAAQPTGRPAAQKLLRLSVANMESPRDIYAEYSHLFEEVGRRAGMEVDFEQRRTYAEVNDLLTAGRLDVALLCTGGYLDVERRSPGAVHLLAVPIINGSDTYQSLIIVPAASEVTALEGLAGKRFAYTEELSLTGRAWVLELLKGLHQNPDGFFGATVFTGSHDRSVTAVARGVVDGAAVHSVIYQHFVARDPALAARTRVILSSPAYGMTPVVVSAQVPAELRARLQQVLLHLGDDPEGAAILEGAKIDRFAIPGPGLYVSAMKTLEAAR